MSTKSPFEQAAANAANLATKPDQDTLLRLYGLYKQATVGDINIAQPWAIQVEARAKWEAWKAREGTTKTDAETEYIKLSNELVKQYGLAQ